MSFCHLSGSQNNKKKVIRFRCKEITKMLFEELQRNELLIIQRILKWLYLIFPAILNMMLLDIHSIVGPSIAILKNNALMVGQVWSVCSAFCFQNCYFGRVLFKIYYLVQWQKFTINNCFAAPPYTNHTFFGMHPFSWCNLLIDSLYVIIIITLLCSIHLSFPLMSLLKKEILHFISAKITCRNSKKLILQC